MVDWWRGAGLHGCDQLAVTVWAMSMIGSLYDYRSPIKDSAPATLPPLGEPVTERLVFILVDGLREDTALDSAVMPNLARLAFRGGICHDS